MEQNILVKARDSSPSSLCLLHYSNPTIDPFRSFQKHPKILLKYLSQKLLQSPKYDQIIFVGLDDLPGKIYKDNSSQDFKMGIEKELGKVIEIDLYSNMIIQDLKENKDQNQADISFSIRLARYILHQLPNYKFRSSLPHDDQNSSNENFNTVDQNKGHEDIANAALIFDSIAALFPIFNYSYIDVKLFINILSLEGCKSFSNLSISPILSILDDNALYVSSNKNTIYSDNEHERTSNVQRWLAMIDSARINIEILPCTVSDNCLNHGTLKMFRKMIKNTYQTNPNLGRVQYDKEYYMIETKLKKSGSVITSLQLRSGLSMCPNLLGISSGAGNPTASFTNSGEDNGENKEVNDTKTAIGNSDGQSQVGTGGGFNIIMETDDSSDEEDEEEDDDDLDL